MDSKLNEFEAHIENWTDFTSWCRWFPDLFLDMIKPEKGGINLNLDQRIFLRSIMRFVSLYGVFPRGYGKCVTIGIAVMFLGYLSLAIPITGTAAQFVMFGGLALIAIGTGLFKGNL